MSYASGKAVDPAGRNWAPHLALFIAALAGMLIKAPGAISRAQFWAEDGVIFFAFQFGHAWPQLFSPYAGYLHVVPRLVAWIASLLPYAQAPLVYNAAAMLLGSWTIAYFAARASLVAPRWACLAIILLAPGNGEIFGTLTNVQWFLQFAVFSMAMLPADATRQVSVVGRLGSLGALLAVSLTGPFSALCVVLLLGLAIFYLLARMFDPSLTVLLEHWWRRVDKPAILTTTLGGMIQLGVLSSGQRANTGPFSIQVAKKLFGEGIERHLFGFAPVPPGILFAALMALAGFALYRTLRKAEEQWLLVLLMLGFASLESLPVCYDGSSVIVSADNLGGDRYFFFMKTSLFMAMIALLRSFPLVRKLRLHLHPPCGAGHPAGNASRIWSASGTD